MDFTSHNPSTAGLINVNGSDDPCYRYKMQPISIDIIAKGGGTTTIINAKQIANDIYRELKDLRRCFAKGISGNVQIIGDQLFISGEHVVDTLQGILYKYIQDNVLCKKCDSPETPIWQKQRRKCRACGHESVI